MKLKLFTLFIVCVLSISCINRENKEIMEIEDKMAIKELVDVFSILADKKDGMAQMALFTKDATVETYIGDKLATALKGQQQIGETFEAFLKNFETVYHINGQQVVTLNGDKASGTSYCLTVLISDNDGEKTKQTIGVRYNDEFVRQDGKWLISARKSEFMWQDKVGL